MIDNLPLLTAVDTVPEKVFREVFKSICKDVPEARMQADKHLLVEKITSLQSEHCSSKDGSPSNADASKIKYKVPRYMFCQNCSKDFATNENSSTACRYHPGKRTSNFTFIYYMDTAEYLDSAEPSQPSEKFHEEIEIDDHPYGSDSYREDMPEYFEFPCCKNTLDIDPHGCKYDWHVEQPICIENVPARKKARVN
ncbi:uncharacterized protein N7483_003605 [Penicillium malachiteum]|uniref:uncharacterized protein n=1 Tax=Penicillium malachiteum TaxID=1324776 RepID=UPI0025482726|nr:uncharacterized protein N7483_003605 [Penicillium malachiteum]KAJ5729097.1 hypothetical protein N7483_003605 [Penicillium malachiteum]